METVEEKLDSLAVTQLRLILTDMALQTPSAERQEFLNKLAPPEDETVKERRTVYQENLLNDIADFLQAPRDVFTGRNSWKKHPTGFSSEL